MYSRRCLLRATRKFSPYLLGAILTIYISSAFQQYFPTILTLLFTRLNNSPPEKFKQRFVRFYHLVSSRDQLGLGADFFIQNSDSVQEGVFPPVYLTIILPITQQLARPLERKLAVISLTKTLTDSKAFAVRYQKGWAKTCEALLKILENPPMPVSSDDAVVEVDVDDLSFGVGFTPLNTCKKVAKDDWPEAVNVKAWVGEYLKAADTRKNGELAGFVQARLPKDAQDVLISYMR